MEEKTLRLDEINFRAMAAMLLRKTWVILLLSISLLLCYTSVRKLTYTPSFTSSATFMVSAKDSTNAYNSLTTTQSMATVFIEVFQSNVLRRKVQEQMPDGRFDGTVNIVTIPETNLFIVTVTSPNPSMCFQALTLLIENYESVSEYLFSNAQLEVIKDPIVPTAPSNPLRLKEQYPAVLFLGLLLSSAAVIAVRLAGDTIQTPKAAHRKLDTRLLRTVRHEIKNKTLRSKYHRKNSAPLIKNALISKQFIEDNLSLCSVLEYHMRKRNQKTVVITSIGENEGKSTIAANLALALAERGRKVILLDCDFRKPSLHKIFEMTVPEHRNLTSYLLQDEEDPSVCLTELKKHGITVGLSRTSSKSIVRLINGGKFARLLQQLREEADYILVDTPPMLAAVDAETIAAMADTSVLIARADYMPASSINNGLDRLRKSSPDVCGLVLNNYRTTIL